jgi:hypothetical protein
MPEGNNFYQDFIVKYSTVHHTKGQNASTNAEKQADDSFFFYIINYMDEEGHP